MNTPFPTDGGASNFQRVRKPPRPQTLLTHHRTVADGARPSVTPLFQSSAFDKGSPYFYTRKDNPNVAEFEECVALLEGATEGVAFATGMAAIKAALELAPAGCTVLLHGLVYGCTAKLVQRFCAARGCELRVNDLSADPLDLGTVGRIGLVLFETPTNPFLRTVDIRRISDTVKAHSPNAVIVVDNTWATPIYQQPLAHGADISLHSATKYFSGHSDVMGGIALTMRAEIGEHLRQERFYSGAVLDPFAAWLLRRSLHTLSIRLEAQARTTSRMTEVLRSHPAITTVYYPEVDGQQLLGYGGIIFVQLAADHAGFERLAGSLRFYGTGTGMACVTSMIAQPYTGSHASMTDAEKQAIGLNHGLVRLCFGLEDFDDLQDDLLAGLESW